MTNEDHSFYVGDNTLGLLDNAGNQVCSVSIPNTVLDLQIPTRGQAEVRCSAFLFLKHFVHVTKVRSEEHLELTMMEIGL